MNERIYNLARQAEQQAREHVRECEYYGYTMIEGTAEDEFHAEFRDRFAELIIRECADKVDWILAEGGKTQGDLIKEHFEVK